MKVMLISGGSGGHLVPAMALADHLQPGDHCLLVSTRRPVDRILATDGAPSLRWETVGLQPFTPLWKWFSPSYLAGQWRAVTQVRSVIAQTRPDVVVGFGGYLSAVGVVAARNAGIPSVIHEQNFIPGRANRLLSRLADAVAVSFPETRRYLPSHACVEATGNPHRLRWGQVDAAQACAEFGFDLERPVLLVMGGSQGSLAVNRLAVGMWEHLPQRRREEVQVLHLAGSNGAAEVEQAYRRLGIRSAVFPFLHRMEMALTAATAAISRAGATGISEMVTMAVPSILIPYPYAGAHQRANAEWVRGIGGAVVLEEAGLSAGRLAQEADALLQDPARLERMRQSLRARADGLAAQKLGDLVRKVGRAAA